MKELTTPENGGECYKADTCVFSESCEFYTLECVKHEREQTTVWCLISDEDYVPTLIGVCATEEIAEHELKHNPGISRSVVRIQEWEVRTKKSAREAGAGSILDNSK
jgi:hypothetical protein